MKYLTTFIAGLICLLMLSITVQAQLVSPMTAYPPYHIYQIGPTDSVTFTASASDTFPRSTTLWATNSSTFKMGGWRYIDLELIVKDTLSTDIYLERRLPAHTGTAAGAYATILTDSLICTANTGKRQVYNIRSPETDLADGLPYEYRLRLVHRSTAGVSSAYIFPRFLWYP